MSNIDEYALSRGKLLRYGAGGAAAVALGGLPAVADAATDAHAAATPKRGGTLNFARSIAPTQLDPANSIIAGDVYTLDKIFEPLLSRRPPGKLTPWLAQELHGQQGRHDLDVPPAPGRQVLRRQAADGRRTSSSRSTVPARTRTARSASSTSRSRSSRRRALDRRGTPVRAVGAVPLRHLGVRERDPAGELRRQDREGVLRQPDRHRPVHARRRFTARHRPHAEAQPALLAGGQALRRRRRPASTSATTTSACCRCAAARSTSSTRCRRRTSSR